MELVLGEYKITSHQSESNSSLRIDFKLVFSLMTAITIWAWLMHYCDMQFNIMPAFPIRAVGFMLHWLDFACMEFIGGLAAMYAHFIDGSSFRFDPRRLHDPRIQRRNLQLLVVGRGSPPVTARLQEITRTVPGLLQLKGFVPHDELPASEMAAALVQLGACERVLEAFDVELAAEFGKLKLDIWRVLEDEVMRARAELDA